MKKIYIIRHGQTDYNVNGILQGSSVDVDLNKNGIFQSLAFYNRYRHIPFKKIYTSTSKRTVQSVESFIQMGIPYEQCDALNEINYGESDGIGKSRGEDSIYRKVVAEWDLGHTNLSMPGGESPDEVKARQQPFIEKLKNIPEEDLILVCMHGRAMRVLLTNLLDLPVSEMSKFPHSNLCLYILNYNGKTFSVEKTNDISHLDLVVEIKEKEELA